MIRHIFQKDVRRLWWAILPSLALTAMLARGDRWRSDYMPGPVEGWLNLLLPVVWAALIALAVEQEPIAGDRQFWITRPYRRGALLAEKALFAAVFVHAPYLLLEWYVVGSRGFSPVGALPHVLWKQVMLAGAVTLPALALASLFRSFTHFILVVFAIAVVSVVISGRMQYGFVLL
ncbi:MAG TPA: hypothetical protein VGF59_27485, partial [Bryobacteraceae bacterium]